MTENGNNAEALGRIEAVLGHMGREIGEIKTELRGVDDRLREVEKTIAGRIKPASVATAISAGIAAALFIFYILDRIYQQGGV